MDTAGRPRKYDTMVTVATSDPSLLFNCFQLDGVKRNSQY